MRIAIKSENLSKAYQLGQIGTGTISRDLERWYARLRGKEDPFLKIGEANDRSTKGTSDIVWSLKDINFEINQGEAVGIIGRNGAGKSTLLKILSKVTSPTTGKISGVGRIASLLEVGTGFHPELSGRENIFLNGAILGMRKKEISSKLDEIVDFAGIERYLDTPVKRYSSGMYVRLAFAVAAHLESEILIVDEVLAVGDAEFQKKCLGKMGEMSKGEGRTVLFVSHNMGSIQQLCNRSIILDQGKISFDGAVDLGIETYNKKIMSNKQHFYLNEMAVKNKVHQITLVNEAGDVLPAISAFDQKTYLMFEIALDLAKGINFGCTLFNEAGEAIMSTPVFDQFSDSQNIQVIKIEFPSNLLKAGSYYLEGALWQHDGDVIEQNDCYLTINVEPRNKNDILAKGVRGILLNPFEWKSLS